ncbi:ABC-type phosphate transport system substrate-binding protein [Streptacidiphilus sp. MAP12-16]|uniref:hypothetical protein n=1 Tax=Streptacidiphilus sp. MAP12-16 TaxID=3156300 RepID=UPI00351951A9
MAIHRTRPAALLLLCGLLSAATTAACASQTSTGVSASAPTPATLHLDEHANRTAVSVPVGSTVVLTLGSTYWSGFASSAPGVLAASGSPQVSPGHTCPPGGGCGTVQVVLHAAAAGTAKLSAARTSCGEARACAPDQRSYTVDVTVTG